MILTNKAILKAIRDNKIIIKPFSSNFLGTTSYDIHLNKYLSIYEEEVLDAKSENKSTVFEIPTEGYVLKPNKLYLATTEEYIKSKDYVPFIQGRSGVARLGIFIHITAPKGDLDYGNHWTLELAVVQPIRIYPWMPIGQVMFYKINGEIEPENQKTKTYISLNHEDAAYPISSKLYKCFGKNK